MSAHFLQSGSSLSLSLGNHIKSVGSKSWTLLVWLGCPLSVGGGRGVTAFQKLAVVFWVLVHVVSAFSVILRAVYPLSPLIPSTTSSSIRAALRPSLPILPPWLGPQ